MNDTFHEKPGPLRHVAQLAGSGLYYYQHASEVASHQNVVNGWLVKLLDSYSALEIRVSNATGCR